MGWDDDYDDGYANGADGSCRVCGDDTAEEWHLYCESCYRAEMGWDEPTAEANGVPSPPAAYHGNEKLEVAWMNGFRAGWAAAADAEAA